MALKKSKYKGPKGEPILVDEDLRKEVGACEHDRIDYKTLEKLSNQQHQYIKTILLDLKRKGSMMELWVKNSKRNTKKINKDWADREAKHDAQIWILRDKCNEVEKELKQYQKEFPEVAGELVKYKSAYEDCIKKNDDFVIQNKELIKEHNEITRAYNGLHQMGKYAEDLGIDISKHHKQLPEYEFHQKHTLLESGKVKHQYKVRRKRKPN
jgi:uncharacterized protein YeeX (DUF496 family)|tara:strand:- start:571 stop:1203 length:633 start_codon:yes stop_codon:yes gene_type:complete